MASLVYERRRPETRTLYHVVQENLDTLYGAVEDGALAIALPKFVKKELEGYLECGTVTERAMASHGSSAGAATRRGSWHLAARAEASAQARPPWVLEEPPASARDGPAA